MPLTQAFEPKRVYREQQISVLPVSFSATHHFYRISLYRKQKTVVLGLVPPATQVFGWESVYREQRQAEMSFARYE